MRITMADLSGNVAVLRRWAHSRPGEPLPKNYQQWAAENGTDAIQLVRKDPELVQLLSGTASASLVADALQGQLSPIPVSEEQREADARKEEAQALYDASRSEQGLNLTQKVRLQSAFPELAAKVQQENPTPVFSEQDIAARAQREAQQLAEVRRESRARSLAATNTRF